LKLIQRN